MVDGFNKNLLENCRHFADCRHVVFLRPMLQEAHAVLRVPRRSLHLVLNEKRGPRKEATAHRHRANFNGNTNNFNSTNNVTGNGSSNSNGYLSHNNSRPAFFGKFLDTNKLKQLFKGTVSHARLNIKNIIH